MTLKFEIFIDIIDIIDIIIIININIFLFIIGLILVVQFSMDELAIC